MKHPITPPSKLLQEWMFELHFQVPHPDYGPMNSQPHWEELIERVAQWAADQELEAIEKEILDQAWFVSPEHRLAQLRTARRPKSPSLKQQALETLQKLSKDGHPCNYQDDADWGIIRRALEALPND